MVVVGQADLSACSSTVLVVDTETRHLSAAKYPYSELLAVAAIERIAKYLPRACKDGNDMEARREMSLAANWAGIAFANTDVHIGHAAADSIAASYHTPHGYNCAMTTPAVHG